MSVLITPVLKARGNKNRRNQFPDTILKKDIKHSMYKLELFLIWVDLKIILSGLVF